MKQFNPTQLQLISFLSDGKLYSGNAIAKQLGISRTAVWKQINQLISLGLKIHRHPRQGYQLNQPFIPVDEKSVHASLIRENYTKEIDFHFFAELDSTNQFLKNLPSSSLLIVCCAEQQTQGRGRFGRVWHSPFGENIYFSSRWQLNCCLSQLSGLSLVISLAIINSLRNNHIYQDIRLKWPNDLFWQDKKLGGVLIEILAETNGYIQLIIGIGLNVNSKSSQDLSTPWCSLYHITEKLYDRNLLIKELILNLDKSLSLFLKHGFSYFHNEWQKVDYLDGHYLTVTNPKGNLSGYASGVNEQGQLCLVDEEGKIHYLSSGDTSIKKEEI